MASWRSKEFVKQTIIVNSRNLIRSLGNRKALLQGPKCAALATRLLSIGNQVAWLPKNQMNYTPGRLRSFTTCSRLFNSNARQSKSGLVVYVWSYQNLDPVTKKKLKPLKIPDIRREKRPLFFFNAVALPLLWGKLLVLCPYIYHWLDWGYRYTIHLKKVGKVWFRCVWKQTGDCRDRKSETLKTPGNFVKWSKSGGEFNLGVSNGSREIDILVVGITT